MNEEKRNTCVKLRATTSTAMPSNLALTLLSCPMNGCAQAVWLSVEPDEVCEAMLFPNRDVRVSELMLRKFMFSSSWTRAWVLVAVEPVELVEPEDALLLADASPAERICWTRPGFACMMLALSAERRTLYMGSVESDPWLPLSML
jgi:hypothetical protein